MSYMKAYLMDLMEASPDKTMDEVLAAEAARLEAEDAEAMAVEVEDKRIRRQG